jgi:hypothetical protein
LGGRATVTLREGKKWAVGQSRSQHDESKPIEVIEILRFLNSTVAVVKQTVVRTGYMGDGQAARSVRSGRVIGGWTSVRPAKACFETGDAVDVSQPRNK